MYLAKKPGARVSPIAFGRRLRNTQRLRRLLDCHADEIPEFDQFRLACVVGGKTVECLVHGELFVFIAAGAAICMVESSMLTRSNPPP